MKIEYINGDLFSTNVRTIAHGCNAQGVMGSGVAKIVKALYPEAFSEYRAVNIKSGLVLGEIITVPCKNKDKIIINAITQKILRR